MDPEPKRMNDLFVAATPELLALAPPLDTPRVPRERALHLTTALRQEFLPLIPTLPGVLVQDQITARMADFEALEPRSLIYYAAELASETPWTSEQKARRTELVVKVREHDESLASWATAAFRKNEPASAVLADIVRGRGIRDDAEDTVRLVGLFRKYWPEVQGKTPLTEAQLSEAEGEATELIGILDRLDEDKTGSPRNLRRRAYTWWARPYLEIFHLARYLVRADPAATDRLPAIANERVAPPQAPDPPRPGAAQARPPRLRHPGRRQRAPRHPRLRHLGRRQRPHLLISPAPPAGGSAPPA